MTIRVALAAQIDFTLTRVFDFTFNLNFDLGPRKLDLTIDRSSCVLRLTSYVARAGRIALRGVKVKFRVKVKLRVNVKTARF